MLILFAAGLFAGNLMSAPLVEIGANQTYSGSNLSLSGQSVIDGNGIFVKGASNSTLQLSDSTVSSNTLTNATNNGGAFISATNVNLDNVDMSGNALNVSAGSSYGFVGGTSISIFNSEYTGNSVVDTNPATNFAYGLVSHVSGSTKTLEVRNSVFSGNSISSSYSAGGVFSILGGASASIYSSTFSGNSATGFDVDGRNAYSVTGSAIRIADTASRLYVQDTVFSDNFTTADAPSGEYGVYGAICNYDATMTFKDCTFTGNSARNQTGIYGGGGAIYHSGGTLNIEITKDALYSGNYVQSLSGAKLDELGGFLYMDWPGAANFDIASGATLTIGNGTDGYDSIASQPEVEGVVINKTGAGTLVVNGSMEYYNGTLNVKGGTMNLGSGAVTAYQSVANDINVTDGSTLDTNYGESARNWLTIKNGQSINLSGEGSTWKHSYQVGVNEGAVMNVGAGSTADLGYLAFGGAAEIDGTLLLGKNWVQALITSNFGGDYNSLGGGKTVMNINAGGVVEAYAGINVGHRADASVSKDAEVNVNAGGTLDIKGGDLNISATNYNDNGTSGKGVVNVNGGTVSVAQAANIGTKADGALYASNGAKVSLNDVTLGVFDESLANDASVVAPSAVFSAKSSNVSVANHLNIGKGGLFSLSDASSLTVSGENGAGDITVRNGGALSVSGNGTSVDISNSQHNIYVNAGGVVSVSNGASMTTSGNLSHGGVLNVDGGTFTVSKLGNIGELNNSAVVNVVNGGVFNSKQAVNLGFYSNYSQANKGGVMNVLGGTVNADSGMTIKNGSVLNVNEAGKINSTVVTIASDGYLNLTLGSSNQINAAVDNSGVFSITAAPTLASGSYGVASGNIFGSGSIKAFGGSYADNVFTVAQAETMKIDTAGEPIIVGDNGRVNLTDAESDEVKIGMAFNSDEASILSVSTVTDSLMEAVDEGFKDIAAYEFDVNMSEGDLVVLSFLVGDATLDLSDFMLYHKSDGGDWLVMDDVSGLAYDGKYLSFEVDGFSSYGYVVVPEPSAYAALFGALALALAAYRRRK